MSDDLQIATLLIMSTIALAGSFSARNEFGDIFLKVVAGIYAILVWAQL